VRLDLTAILVDDYDEAIAFFVHALGFDLAEDQPATSGDGRPKRWVVVRPPAGGPGGGLDGGPGLLLARAEGEQQRARVGDQHGGRVGFFLRVEDFAGQVERMEAHGVQFVEAPRREAYGEVAIFLDVAGNRWDLLGPASTPA
jgi:catechol 2,3-dioxygenase-like lactoylglutathione lyase family enzyme